MNYVVTGLGLKGPHASLMKSFNTETWVENREILRGLLDRSLLSFTGIWKAEKGSGLTPVDAAKVM